jgi:ABC-type lipoprotein release transport system permease subunit
MDPEPYDPDDEGGNVLGSAFWLAIGTFIGIICGLKCSLLLNGIILACALATYLQIRVDPRNKGYATVMELLMIGWVLWVSLVKLILWLF